MLNHRLVDIFASYPVAKHLHISLQSGSNRVLRAMRRSGIEHLPKMLEILRKIDYGFAFTADIIVGFPDETEQDLLLTMLILEEFNFAKLHLFPFSPRPNTPAWAMRQLNQSVVSERMRLMEQQEKHLRQKFLQSQMGLKRPSVFLKSENAALTDNFIYVPCSAFKGIQNVEVTESSYIM
jgi:threonylcarbamoyladenosine tRNA methylthiotransferase MtaB